MNQKCFSRVNDDVYICVYFDCSELCWSAVGSCDCAAEPRISAKEDAWLYEIQIVYIDIYAYVYTSVACKYSTRDKYVTIQPRCLRGMAAQALRLVFTPGTAKIDPSPTATSTSAKLPGRTAPSQSSCWR